MKTLFITGIDTDAGKSIATGYLAKYLLEKGKKIITQKMIQTGCKGIAEDIITHRNIMNCKLFPEDKDLTTCPQVFQYPASPHLSAQLENTYIDIQKIKESTTKLEAIYDVVLLEGAGGLHVPLTKNLHTIDYIEKEKLPTILVTNSKLGSINHTLLSLEVLKIRKIPIKGVIYNHFPQDSNLIFEDTRKILQKLLPKYSTNAIFWELPVMNADSPTPIFNNLLE